jgi:EmrB/QacA subfamily drug resistance transporter
MTQLIFFRALQGIGGGAMMVNSFAIIGEVFPPAERGKYQGIIGGVFGLSSVAGPLLGGWITDNTSWRWVFYVNIPIGIIALVILYTALPKMIARFRDKKIDWWGAIFITGALVPLLVSLVWGGSVYAWSSWQVISCLITSVISLVLFTRIEKTASNPILSPGLFHNRIFVISSLSLFITNMGMFGAIVYIPVFSQGVIGGSATHAGLVLTPLMLSLVTASTISGRIISKTGRYKFISIAGTAIILAGLFFFSTINTETGNGGLIIRMIILGAGLGSTMPIFTLAVQSAFPNERLGEVTAGTQLFRNVGGTVGTAVLGGIMNMRLGSQLEHMNNEPFFSELSRLDLSKTGLHADATIIQVVLNPDSREQIRSILNKNAEGHSSMITHFEHFIYTAKNAFSRSVDDVFLVAGSVMIIALVLVCFLPEIPLRKSHRPALEEMGIELEEEFGQSDEGHQPGKQN